MLIESTSGDGVLRQTLNETEIRRDAAMVAFGLDDWDAIPQTRHHILTGLAARNWAITYSNGPHFVWDIDQPRWTHATWRSRRGASDGVRLCWPGRWLVRWPRFGSWDQRILKRYMRTFAGQAGWAQARYRVAYLFHPSFVPYLAELGECRLVYHADDSFSKMPGWTRDLEIAERNLVARADLVIATSPGVRRNLPDSGPMRAHVLQNGADVELFATASRGEVPPDLLSIPPPRIGYFGTVNPKVDLGLVDALARLRPDWHWIFVGRFIQDWIMADPPSRDAWLRLRNRSNVHFLGPRPYRDLPRYQAHMDVNTLCYRTDPGGWWTDLSPLKLYEYLTVGRPVVAASLEVLNPLHHVVAVAESLQQWLDALSHAIYESGIGTLEQRREVAFANGWKDIAAQLDSWLISMVAR